MDLPVELINIVRWLHVLGACVLIGTGSGIAFFMVIAHHTGNATNIAHTATTVVIADTIFTATAAIAQPITGAILMWQLGWALTDGWLLLSLFLYVFIGLFWIPVLFIQIKMRDEARISAAKGEAVSARYKRLYLIWFTSGIPAFAAIMLLLWLMLMKPEVDVPFLQSLFSFAKGPNLLVAGE